MGNGAVGHFLFVLHAHQPFVDVSRSSASRQEEWLPQAALECYVPLIESCEALLRDGIDAPITLEFSPSLCEMLLDPARQDQCVRYLEERIDYLNWQMRRFARDSNVGRVLNRQISRLRHCREVYVYAWRRDAVSRLRRLAGEGAVSILASAATHAYLPLWELFPDIVELQIRLGISAYRACFGCEPKGFWLPECGYYPGLDRMLACCGIKYFFVDTHGVLHGDPRPKFGEYAPVHTSSGVAVFGRDQESHDQVWREECGYPGEASYLSRLETGELESPEWEHRSPRGIRLYSRSHPKRVYDAHVAYARSVEHADHFVGRCRQQAARLASELKRPPVVTALFDAEHFGHWWQEGGTWLELVRRRLACDSLSPKLSTAEEYLGANPRNQKIEPSASSWGYQGYSETWLMGRNHWIYPALYSACDNLKALVLRHPSPTGVQRMALNQYIRELLLSQFSDWAFLMHSQVEEHYAERQVAQRLHTMTEIGSAFEREGLDESWLASERRRGGMRGENGLIETYSRILRGWDIS